MDPGVLILFQKKHMFLLSLAIFTLILTVFENIFLAFWVLIIVLIAYFFIKQKTTPGSNKRNLGTPGSVIWYLLIIWAFLLSLTSILIKNYTYNQKIDDISTVINSWNLISQNTDWPQWNYFVWTWQISDIYSYQRFIFEDNNDRSDGETKTRTSLDTHYIKMEMKDETLLRMDWWLDPLIITFNNVLEDIVNDKIQEEKYWMNEVIPLSYLYYDTDKKRNPFRPWKFKCMRNDYSAYENFFFGTNAKNITSMKETSTYRWSFRNLDDITWLTTDSIQSSDYPASDVADEIDPK